MGGRREKADELVASSRHETIIGLGEGKKGSDSQLGSKVFRIHANSCLLCTSYTPYYASKCFWCYVN